MGLIARSSLDVGGRLLARWHARPLTREIAAGADPNADEQLRLRADRLTSARERHAIAEGLRNAIAAAEHPDMHLTARAPVDTAAVLAARDALEELADALDRGWRARARGVAMAEVLVTDADSPLYGPGTGPSLRQRARAALAAVLEEGYSGVTYAPDSPPSTRNVDAVT
jgi:hypothetical protein